MACDCCGCSSVLLVDVEAYDHTRPASEHDRAQSHEHHHHHDGDASAVQTTSTANVSPTARPNAIQRRLSRRNHADSLSLAEPHCKSRVHSTLPIARMRAARGTTAAILLRRGHFRLRIPESTPHLIPRSVAVAAAATTTLADEGQRFEMARSVPYQMDDRGSARHDSVHAQPIARSRNDTGKWHVMQDAVVYGLFNHQGGQRGGDEMRVPNWWMGCSGAKRAHRTSRSTPC